MTLSADSYLSTVPGAATPAQIAEARAFAERLDQQNQNQTISSPVQGAASVVKAMMSGLVQQDAARNEQLSRGDVAERLAQLFSPHTAPGGVASPAGLAGGASGPDVAGVPGQYADAIKNFEGFEPRAKWDVHQYSYGYGTRAGGPNETIDLPTANARFADDMTRASQVVDGVNPNLSPGTRAALISLTHNTGDAWTREGLGRAVAAGDENAAKQHFLQYVNVAGEPNSVIAGRRNTEASWFGQRPSGSPQAQPAAVTSDAAVGVRPGQQYAQADMPWWQRAGVIATMGASGEGLQGPAPVSPPGPPAPPVVSPAQRIQTSMGAPPAPGAVPVPQPRPAFGPSPNQLVAGAFGPSPNQLVAGAFGPGAPPQVNPSQIVRPPGAPPVPTPPAAGLPSPGPQGPVPGASTGGYRAVSGAPAAQSQGFSFGPPRPPVPSSALYPPMGEHDLAELLANPWVDVVAPNFKANVLAQMQPRTIEGVNGDIWYYGGPGRDPILQRRGMGTPAEETIPGIGQVHGFVYQHPNGRQTFTVPGYGTFDEYGRQIGGPSVMPGGASGAAGAPGAPPGAQNDIFHSPMVQGGIQNQADIEAAKKTAAENATNYAQFHAALQGASRLTGGLRPLLQTANTIVNDPNFYSGSGADAIKYLRRAGVAANFLPKDAATPMEAFNKVIAAAVLQQTNQLKAEAKDVGDKAGRVFKNQSELMEQAAPSAENTVAGNRYLVNYLGWLADRTDKIADMADRYSMQPEKHGTLDANFDITLRHAMTDPKSGLMVPKELLFPHPSAAQPPAGQVSVPPSAIEFLRANPQHAEQFDQKYGAGAAAKVLGAQQRTPAGVPISR